MQIHFSAVDASAFAISAVVDDGCEQFPVIDGDIYHRRCGDDEGENDPDANSRTPPKRCHPRQANLIVSATDVFGNMGSCTLDLCSLYRKSAPAQAAGKDVSVRYRERGPVIRYHVTSEAYVRLTIYNILGRRVKELVRARQPAGHYSVPWHSQGAPSGVYTYRLEYAGTQRTGKILLIR